MKHFIIFILFINCLFTQDEKLKISILDIDGQGIKKTSVNASFQSLETSLIESNQFIVIEKGKRDEILKEQKEQTTSGCFSDACAVEVGQLIGADYLVITTIINLDEIYQINVKIIDILEGDVSEKVTLTVAPKITALLTGMEDASREIVRRIARGAAPVNTYGQQPGDQVPTQAKAYGNLDISTEPTGASILIDGIDKGTTPKIIPNLTAENHTLLLIYPNYETLKKIVSIKADQTITVNEILAPKTGDIEIYSKPPGATIELEGEYRGVTPKTLRGILTGDYNLILNVDDYKKHEQSITIIHNDAIKKDIELIPLPAKVTIIGDKKDNVKVKVLGETYNIDGFRTIELPAGKQTLEFSRRGYRGYSVNLNLPPNGSEEVDIKLNKFKSKKIKQQKGKPDKNLGLAGNDAIEEKPYLFGVGISYGLPAILNYNLRLVRTQSIWLFENLSFEFAWNTGGDDDECEDSDGCILGKQFTIGLGNNYTTAWNLIFGTTEFYGAEAYPALYSVQNNKYEYYGITYKKYKKLYYWEIGANWGDEQFYGGKAQFYFQLGTMVNVRF